VLKTAEDEVWAMFDRLAAEVKDRNPSLAQGGVS
jgi:hypothetical protein